MKTIPMPEFDDFDEKEKWMNDGTKRFADWKDRVEEVLNSMDSMDSILKSLELEIVQYNTGGDYYLWEIRKIEV